MKKIIIFCLGLFLIASCKKYLTEDAKSYLTSDAFYKTKTGYLGLINSAYSTLRNIYKVDPYMFEAGTDMTLDGRTPSSMPEGLFRYKDLSPVEDPTIGTEIKNLYTNCFSSIRTVNCGLFYNDTITTISVADLNRYQGELRALRAFDYFLLVQQFGGVPIVKEYTKGANLSYDRNTAAEVYDFIISEFKAAESLVPEATAGTLPTGRFNKRVIRHFLAKVYLTRGYETFADVSDFNNAGSYADSAISSQKLTINFENLFYPGNEQNAEVLFAVQFDPSSILDPKNSGNRQNAFFGPYLGGEGATAGYPIRNFSLNPTLYAINLFTADDSRYDATFMTNVYGTFNSSGKYLGRYYDYYDQAANRANLPIAYYYPPKWASSDSAIAAWKASDPVNRSSKYLTIFKYSGSWEPTTSSKDLSTIIVKKFDDPKSQFSQTGSSTRDIFLARLGETYLIAAEAYFKVGDAATAALRINEVRKRAAKSGKDLSITASSIDMDFILDERGRELLGEYHRWFDLKRTGTLKTRTKLFNRDIKALFDSGVDPFSGANGVDKILRPIPQSEIDANQSANFQQNPAYN